MTNVKKKTVDSFEVMERLIDLKDELHEKLDEVQELLESVGFGARADAYWMAHIKMALDKQHEYLGGSMVTMQDTIDELEGEIEGWCECCERTAETRMRAGQKVLELSDGQCADCVAERHGEVSYV